MGEEKISSFAPPLRALLCCRARAQKTKNKKTPAAALSHDMKRTQATSHRCRLGTSRRNTTLRARTFKALVSLAEE